MVKGWFQVPGIRPEGDRTRDEQMLGLGPALQETSGKTVLDLGAAEAVISREFALAGASRVVAMEVLQSHLDIAKEVCKDVPCVELRCVDLREHVPANPNPEQFDIVLALGIIHKIRDPGLLLRWAAKAAKNLLLFRAPAHAWNGHVRAKYGAGTCHVPTIMSENGFRLEKHIAGARGEGVEYWRR